MGTSSGSRISPRWGRQLPRGEVPTYDFAKISQKLREIERIWTRGGARPKFYYVDPPLGTVTYRSNRSNINRKYKCVEQGINYFSACKAECFNCATVNNNECSCSCTSGWRGNTCQGQSLSQSREIQTDLQQTSVLFCINTRII